MKKFILLLLVIILFQDLKPRLRTGQCTEHYPSWTYIRDATCCNFLNPLPDGSYQYSNIPVFNNVGECYQNFRCWKNEDCSSGCCIKDKCVLKCPDGSCSCHISCSIHQECDADHCCDAATGKCSKPKCKDGTCNCYLTKSCNNDSDCGPNACCNLKAITTDKQTCQLKCKDGTCNCWRFKNLGEACYTNFDCDTNQHHYCGDLKLDKTKGALIGTCKQG